MGVRREGRKRLYLLYAGVAALGAAMATLGTVALIRSGGDLRKAVRFESKERHFEWRSLERRHWQAMTAGGTAPEPIETTDARENTRGACPPGMVGASGKTLLDSFGSESSSEVEELQNQTCTSWLNRDFPARCQTFDRSQWLGASAKLPRKALDFCIDRYEYPNRFGENPVIVVTYTEAAGLCKANGKRLCTETEWTFACEGEEGMPYPYGYDRDLEACVVDRPWRPFAVGALDPRDGEDAREELDRLWQGLPSGSRPRCKSAFGAYDLTGNVDEWTQSVRKTGYASVLKGGYWGPVRARCRPSTRAHNETFVAYQQSFRCCADAGAAVGAGRDLAETTRDAGKNPVIALAPGGDAAEATAKNRAANPAPPLTRGPELLPLPAVPPAMEDDELDALRVRPGPTNACAGNVSGARTEDIETFGPLAIMYLLRIRRRRPLT